MPDMFPAAVIDVVWPPRRISSGCALPLKPESVPTPAMLRTASVSVRALWSLSTARGTTCIDCGVSRIGASVFVAAVVGGAWYGWDVPVISTRCKAGAAAVCGTTHGHRPQRRERQASRRRNGHASLVDLPGVVDGRPCSCTSSPIKVSSAWASSQHGELAPADSDRTRRSISSRQRSQSARIGPSIKDRSMPSSKLTRPRSPAARAKPARRVLADDCRHPSRKRAIARKLDRTDNDSKAAEFSGGRAAGARCPGRPRRGRRRCSDAS